MTLFSPVINLTEAVEPRLAFKRAGVDGILTYFAREIAEELQDE